MSKWDVDFVAFVAFVDFVETAHARPSENKFSWCSLNRSLAKKKAALLSLQAEKCQFLGWVNAKFNVLS